MENELISFGDAINAVNAGKRVTRKSWHEPSFIFLVNGSKFTVNREPLLSILGEGTEVSYHAHIDVRMPDGTIGVYNPHCTDLVANDWYVI